MWYHHPENRRNVPPPAPVSSMLFYAVSVSRNDRGSILVTLEWVGTTYLIALQILLLQMTFLSCLAFLD